MMEWSEQVRNFIEQSNKTGLRILMVGGGAVNWHGYKRHSADVDFWIDRTDANLRLLLEVLSVLNYELEALPQTVVNGLQNVSLKFSPTDLDVELITRFDVNKSFEAAYLSSTRVQGPGSIMHYWHVLSFDDLVISKLKAGRPKDLLDVYELNRMRSNS